MKKKLEDFESTSHQEDLHPTAYSVRTCLQTDNTTLVGMISTAIKPKMVFIIINIFNQQNVVDFVEDLSLAGIRFVYFSPSFERESKAFADRLGLETDWNACILLSRDSSSRGYLEPHDIKARLPRGIDDIRQHIEQVDDIPLHVSLFAECHPKDTAEMIKIFQENDEVVCCIGSSLSTKNISSFVQVN